MAGFTEKLGRRKEEAIVALLSQRNVEEAARASTKFDGPRSSWSASAAGRDRIISPRRKP